MFKLLTKIVGTKNERILKKLSPVIDNINELEPSIASLSDTQLKQKSEEFKNHLEKGAAQEELLPEVFAVVREVSKRALGMRHFDVQLIGGIILHQGKITEMKTGEGKTLVATLAVVLNALDGRGVHIVTVNDYLAKRDTQWMGPIYHFLGLSVGVIQHEESFLYDPSYQNENKSLQSLRPVTRQDAYHADITYGTNNEFGFDYLRDNMRYDISDFVQRELNYAIVDEVDSILIDEARTPLIISGPSEDSTDKYYKIDKIIPKISSTHYVIDEKAKTVTLTEEGNARVEEILNVGNLFEPANIEIVHHVNQALRAHTLFKRETDYLVKDGKVIIVDEFTGRLMPGRRWSDGLHQAIEAKENVKIENENQTLATITFQNYFRMYNKLSGMTGTADTEAEEFAKIYNLDVVVIPTNKPMRRDDHPDVIYKTEKAKFSALAGELSDCYKRGQPVLVGTVSIEKSEVISSILKRKGIPHSVLNAKYHEKEAEIITQAGRSQSITIATNMAGRGTDIVLGGNFAGLADAMLKDKKESPSKNFEKDCLEKAEAICEKDKQKVLSLGGLHIIGTERHEARRIDNQLRGRSGRQGDPGSSRFYLSLEDDLMRIFGSDRISKIMGKLGMDESVPIEHKIVSKAVENAQKKVEAHNFEIRKHLLEYDDVMNQQRTEIYSFRRDILAANDLKEKIFDMVENVVDEFLFTYCSDEKHMKEWDLNGLQDVLYGEFSLKKELNASNRESLREEIIEHLHEFYENKEKEVGSDTMRYLEKVVALQVLDIQWKDHLLAMDHLKEGIGLRGYGQRDPKVEYKKEAYEIFSELGNRISTETVGRLFKIRIATEENVEQKFAFKPLKVNYNRSDSVETTKTIVKQAKTGRNAPCPCGSGKKYKKCCALKIK